MRCFRQRHGGDQALPPVFIDLIERALRLAQSLAPLRRRFRVDQIGETFDPRQVELAILERAAGKLAGLAPDGIR